MKKKKWEIRRKKVLIEKSSQIYLSLMILVYLVIYTIVMLIVMLVPSVIRFSRSSIPIEEQFMASREFLLLDQRVVPVIVIMTIIMAVHFIFITHRIFGPFKRLTRMCREWKEGIWPKPFKPRSKDFENEFFDAFNEAVAGTKEDMLSVRQGIDSALARLKEAKREGLPEDSASNIEEAESICREALVKLNHYHM